MPAPRWAPHLALFPLLLPQKQTFPGLQTGGPHRPQQTPLTTARTQNKAQTSKPQTSNQ